MILCSHYDAIFRREPKSSKLQIFIDWLCKNFDFLARALKITKNILTSKHQFFLQEREEYLSAIENHQPSWRTFIFI